MRPAAGVGLDKALSTGQEREHLTNVRMAPNGAEPNSDVRTSLSFRELLVG